MKRVVAGFLAGVLTTLLAVSSVQGGSANCRPAWKCQPVPTSAPTVRTTLSPTSEPSITPTLTPTSQLTAAPTPAPTLGPTPTPTPTLGPTPTPAPTLGPTPTPAPTLGPSPTLPSFTEECHGPGLNPKWTALVVPGDPGFGLDSDFLGDLSRVSVANGVCTITAARTTTPSGRAYASAAMGTRTTFSQLYGTFEARIRYPAGQGVWPAFWTLEAGQLTTPPEVDIFEAYPAPPGAGGGSGVQALVTALHTAANPSRWFVVDRGSDLTTAFHTHRLMWSPGLMVFSLDGVETGRFTSDIPAVPMYPILNLALGAPGFRVDATTPAVLTMEIDWVRVWRPDS